MSYKAASSKADWCELLAMMHVHMDCLMIYIYRMAIKSVC